MSLSTSLLVLAAVLPGQAPGMDYTHNFRGGNMPPADRMVVAGLDDRVEFAPEQNGLHIKVLADRGKDGVGMETRFSLLGDFEITASYEVLAVDKPTKGYGVGVYLTIAGADFKTKRAALARIWTVNNGSGFQSMLINLVEPEPINKYSWEPSDTMKGQLRLRREGAKLLYLANEDLGQPFREIYQFDFGTENIDKVRFVANPGNSPAALDVRLLDVRMHWSGLPEHAATAAPSLEIPITPGLSGGSNAVQPRNGVAFWLLLLALLPLLPIGIACWYWGRRRRADANDRSHTPAPVLPTDPNPPST